jgi:hypothetical protein
MGDMGKREGRKRPGGMNRRKFLALRTRCRDCGIDVTKSGDWYMVHDHIWALSGLGPVDGVLCVADLERRIGRRLVLDDFQLMTGEGGQTWRHGERMVPRVWRGHLANWRRLAGRLRYG